MTLSEAIEQANYLRPNAIDDIPKQGWIRELEGELAEMMGDDVPEVDSDSELLMPAPYDHIYPLYLAAMIDYAQEETQLYSVDIQIANSAIHQARAWWWRNHGRTKRTEFEVMH